MKTCKGPCGKEKHRSEFQKDKGTSDGCYAYCRVCNNARMKKKRQDATYRKREREQQNVYRITPAAKQRRRDIYAASNATEHGNLLTRLKNRLVRFKDSADTTHNQDLFGCTSAEFRAHIESLMEPWMDWHNYGRAHGGEYNKKWSFDHIVPYAAFPGDELEDYQRVVCWYKNVRPLCAKKNGEEFSHYNEEDKQALITKYIVHQIVLEII